MQMLQVTQKGTFMGRLIMLLLCGTHDQRTSMACSSASSLVELGPLLRNSTREGTVDQAPPLRTQKPTAMTTK